MHGVLTADHLFDGTITTASEQYYIEPASRYLSSRNVARSRSDDRAPEAGAIPAVHSVVYKVSDVRHPSSMSPLQTTRHQQKQPQTQSAPPQTKDDDDEADSSIGNDDATEDDRKDVDAAAGAAMVAVGDRHTFCASERLRRKMQMDFKRRRKNDATLLAKDVAGNANDAPAKAADARRRRTRRWLPDEVRCDDIHFLSNRLR